ncbi:glucose dehydrogenase [FAD, quinone]-like [Anopheles ziemanni]|uniref:glucose dehydrogenase [FAD, quinone]-like n=1 Tax=Anopheles coustani TaxID=139045 RepID=UPI002657E7CB|nr:glucose dehydrogenase [FAD, quinone]-like [Anopheles coustani]XP_058169751.1 glucose dehydrogenase [FAD, quinone]-like [Anopheles ziemanni]
MGEDSNEFRAELVASTLYFIASFVLILYYCPKIEASESTFFQTLFDETSALFNNASDRIPDTNIFRKEYDFIVIGAGSGGSVMANRLTELREWNVLLLEAGKEGNMLTEVPLTAGLTTITGYNWGYKADPMEGACLGLKGGVCNWPKGRGLGGTSLINFLIYTRGHRRDYDGWEQAGNPGWGYRDVLEYFKKSERVKIPSLRSSPYRSTVGPVDVEESSFETPLLRRFIDAGKELGYLETDSNGEIQLGFGKAQATMRNGRRCSAAKAYLVPAARRPNLDISMNSRVTKILIDPLTKLAYGVEFIKHKRRYVIRARKEVILAAGAIASPQLLMLSGVGPREHLQQVGVPVVQDLPVGYNLQDHVNLPGLVFPVNQPVTVRERDMRSPKYIFDYLLFGRGPFTVPGGAEGVAFVKTNISYTPSDYPDIELVMGTGAYNNDESGSLRETIGITDEFYHRTYGTILGKHAFAISPILMRPKSRGRIYLKSANPFRWPRMDGNFFGNYDDLAVLREGAKLTVTLVESRHFRSFGAKLHTTPFLGCEGHRFRSDEYWECAIRRIGSSLQHQCGTCKMGPTTDPEAVVNPQLQVYGIRGLRVVDASIIPTIPASHTNAVVFMIGEKAADMVKEFWVNEIR